MNCWISMIPPPTSLPRPISEWIKSTSLALKRSNFYVPDIWHCILFQRAKAKQPIINGYSGPGPEPPPGACGINASDFPLKLRLSVSLSSEICKRSELKSVSEINVEAILECMKWTVRQGLGLLHWPPLHQRSPAGPGSTHPCRGCSCSGRSPAAGSSTGAGKITLKIISRTVLYLTIVNGHPLILTCAINIDVRRVFLQK